MSNTGRDMESKSEKFIRLANARTNKCVAAIRSLSKLSNENHYSHSDAQAEQIIRELRDELENLKLNFKKRRNKKAFTLHKDS
jgi:glutamate-1-semialdehyde aminotransferase